ncbi:MAG: hypothetical protein AAF587_33810 [Bacteroidota bacterium]
MSNKKITQIGWHTVIEDPDESEKEVIIPRFGQLLEKREIRLTSEGQSKVEVSRIFNWRTEKGKLTLEENKAMSELPSSYHSLQWSYECWFPPSPNTLSSEQILLIAEHFLPKLDPFQPLANSALSQLKVFLKAPRGTLPFMLEYEDTNEQFFLYIDRKTFAIGAEGIEFGLGIIS